MDEDVPWLWSLVVMFLIFLWCVGAVTFGLAHLNAQVSAHRGTTNAAAGIPFVAYGAAYGNVARAPSWAADEALRWGGGELHIGAPFASWAFGRQMAAQGGALSGIERFYPGPPAVFE